MKHSFFQRFLTLFLCFSMVLPYLTRSGWAAETGTEDPSTQSQKETGWVPVDPEDIPAYSTASGKVSQELECDCGNGLSRDGAQSHMTMVTGTNESEYRTYLTALEEAGFTKTFENSIAAQSGNNLFSKWLSPKKDYVLTVYYTPVYGEVHIIADTAEDMVKSFSGGFKYESTTGETAEVMMTMYGLSMSPNGYDTTTAKPEYGMKMRNCGALIVIRMPDNSLFINDGGDLQQWSDEFCADFMDFCREITGKEAGEKVVINSWFISHAHSDHFEGIPRFFDKYHDQIDIKNVMYSLDDEMIGSTRDMTQVLRMIKAYFPEVTYYKPHTGDKFDIAGIEFDVLYTQEDRFLPAADGSLSCGKVSSKLREGGTYRDFLQDLNEHPEGGKYDFNDTSTVLKVTFPKEETGGDCDYDTILYADTNLADQIMIDMYAPSVLTTDIMMVPHHGHDAHPELVAMSGADIFLYTQHKQAIYGPDGVLAYEQKVNSAGEISYGSTNDADGTYRPNLLTLFVEMYDQDADNDGQPDRYFDTVPNVRKTYWEGSETAVIVFGEDQGFAEADALGLTKDSEDPAGYSVYTKEAPNFPYGGWTLLSNVVGKDVSTTDKVTTTTHTIRANGVEVNDKNSTKNDILVPGEKYIIVHNKTDFVMSYTALNGTNDPMRAGSLVAATRPEVDNGTADVYFAYKKDDATSSDDKLYFTQHMRDELLWEFSLTDIFDTMDKDGDRTDGLTHTGYTPFFGGDTEEFFYRSYWFKGLSTDAVYWYTDSVNADTAWSYMLPSTTNLFLQAADTPTYNTRIEFFDDGGSTDTDDDGIIEACDTCVIYYHKSNNDYRFLTVDEAGNWVQKKYTSVDAAMADLDDLKLRLYQYEELTKDTDIKTVDSVGPQTYYATVGTGKAALIDSISYQLTVRDSYRRWMPIPCSGTTAKTGYYWLDGDLDASTPKESKIQVKYRNDDGTDTLVTTLTLYVHASNLLDHDVVAEGMAATNTSFTGNVFESRADDGVITDRVMTVVVDTEDGYERKEISLSVGMLSCDADSTVTVPGGTATSAGVPGTMVDTAVEAGTVYEGLTLTHAGQVITDDFTLTFQEISVVDEPKYPEFGSVVANKTGTPGGASFATSGIANIQLSATGIPETEGVDMIITLDMSGSMSYAVTSEDPTSRLDALKQSMKELIATLQQSDVDFRIAISDFGDLDNYFLDGAVVEDNDRLLSFIDASNGTDWNDGGVKFGSNHEFYNHLNFVFQDYQTPIYCDANSNFIDQSTYDALSDEEKKNYFLNRDQPWTDTITKWNKVHDQYMGNLEPNVYTGSTKADAAAFVSVKDRSYEDWCALIDGFKQGTGYLFGTNYDRGLEYMYRLGHAIRQDNIDHARNREVVAVFMSDGAPMQYNYFSGRTITKAWADWFTGAIDPNKFQSAAFDKDNTPVALAELRALMLQILNTNATALDNPDALFYRSSDAESRQVTAGIVKEDGTAKYDDNSAVRGYNADGSEVKWGDMVNSKEAYFLLEKIETSKTFYNAMVRNGITLDAWGFERIAKVNGFDIDVETATVAEIREIDAKLLQIAQSATEGNLTLRYPTVSNSTRHLYDPAATDLDEALERLIGRPVGYTELAQIAYRATEVKLTVDGTEVTYNLRDNLKAIVEEVTVMQDGMEWATLSPYHYFYNEEGKSWWAEAIKGDSDKLYPVINKYAHDESFEGYNGTIRNYYDDGSDAAWAGQDYIGGFQGLEIPVYTLAMSIGSTNTLSHADTVHVLESISSGKTYAYAAYSGEDLNEVFNAITSSVTHAATQGYYVDTLGKDYDLQTYPVKNVEPAIEVREYILDAEHKRTGEYRVLERVTFEDGEVAKSDVVYDSVMGDSEIPVLSYPDIWKDNGLIDAKYFYYNTNTAGTNVDRNSNGTLSLEEGDVVDGAIRLDLSGDGKLDHTLAPETFFWILGNIGYTELVLDYPVLLTGSDSDDPSQVPEAGVYPTNESAKLYYVNYLGNDIVKDTVSPEFPWGDDMSVDKKVEENGDDYLLTLEAFANGQTTTFSSVEPADIVLVLDQSASMYTPAGYTDDDLPANGVVEKQNNGELPAAAKIADFVSKVNAGDEELLSNAMRPGYYIAVHNTYNYIYIVQYIRYDRGEDLYDVSDDKWGWFYVPVPNTTTPVTFNTETTYNSTDDALAVRGTYAQNDKSLLSNVTYYKSQYGALYDSVTAFVKDLNAQAMKTGVHHRVAIVGFASPFYDAHDYYQGTGIYVDGQYYLYDDEYLYKGRYENGVLVRDDANGDVILDPDRGYADQAYPMNLFAADPSEYEGYVGIGDRYGSAFVDISTEAGLQSVMDSLNAVRTNYLQTCPAIGLRIARSIFRGKEIPLNDPLPVSTTDSDYKSKAEELIQKADPTGKCPEGKDQFIILFTDGTPTVSMYADYEKSNSATQNREVNAEYWTGNGGAQDAINEANAAKREGVTVYTIGTAAATNKYGNKGDAANVAADDRVEFLELVSSEYPNASCVHDVVPNSAGNDLSPSAWNLYVDYGTQAQSMDHSYALSASEENALTIAFSSVMESITAPTVELDEEDILRDVLSDYFDLIGSTEAEIKAGIKVYTAAFDPDGTVVPKDQWIPISSDHITLGKSDPSSSRLDTVDVTGYDYHTEYYSLTPREVNGKDYYGSKLIVQIPIKVASGFTGGIDVPTNEGSSAIYDKGDGGEKVVIPFPIPTVDIDSGMVTNKTAEKVEGTDDQYLLTLEAYATGSLRELTSTKPADIVLVLDHSASMRTPVGATEILHSGADQIYGYKGQTDKGQITHADLLLEKGQHLGYYVAQSQATGSWFIMQYQPDKQLWDLHLVPSTQSLVHSADGNEVTKTLTSSHAYLNDATGEFKDLVFYKSQYAMLYESVLSFVTELHGSGVAHNVAIVGFAGSTTFGSRLYVGGDETGADGSVHKKYETMYYHANASEARRTELYQKAMKNVAMDAEYSELLTLVEAIDTNFSFTCPAVGLKMANDIFKANPVDAAARDRIVVLFTDGLPNVMIDEDAIDPSNTSEQIFDEIIGQSYIAKNTHGAQVYSISTSTTGDKASDRLFLSYTSSDYPNATSFAAHGDPVEDAPVFTKEVSSFEDMDLAFGNVTNNFASTTVKLDGSTLLVEILSEYFDLLNQGKLDQDGNYMDIRVYKQPYSPTGWKEKILMGDEAIITLTSSDNSDRLDTVTVAGFDYAAEFVSEIPRTVNGVDHYGSKIVVEVDIITREGFWGGENVPTNDVKTGLYPEDSKIPAEIFPVPEIDTWPDIQVEDTVVIDYGLDVQIDLLGAHPLLHGESRILGFVDEIPGEGFARKVPESYSQDAAAGDFGTMAIGMDQEKTDGTMRYALSRSNGMQMQSSETFYYVGQYTADGVTAYYYGKVTVVPATSIYFEEDFLTFDANWTGVNDGSQAADTQDQDRPGADLENALGALDADNIYGKDSAYVNDTAYSNGSAEKTTVYDYTSGYTGVGSGTKKTAAATFRFTGTGFDVVSLTSNKSGVVMVNVFELDENGNRKDSYDSSEEFGEDNVLNPYKTTMVDTYYGYTYMDGEWVVVSGDDEKAIYQIPVIKIEDLPYGLYEAEVYVAYNDWFANDQYKDANGNVIPKYDFYLDAIRVYDPANDGADDAVIQQIYQADGEGWPSYHELRDLLLPTTILEQQMKLEEELAQLQKELEALGTDPTEEQKQQVAALEQQIQTKKEELAKVLEEDFQGAIFIDGRTGTMSAADYANYGPNNELYLEKGQSVYFQIDTTDTNIDRVHLAMKSLGGQATVQIYSNGDLVDTIPVATATDLYYDITGLGKVTIKNVGSASESGILSITNVKTTFKEDPAGISTGALESGPFTANGGDLNAVLLMLNGPVTDPGLTLQYPSLSFEDEIFYNVYFTAGDITDVVEMGLMILPSMMADGTVDDAVAMIPGYLTNGAVYMARTNGIPAAQMGDTVYFRVYAKLSDGSYVYSTAGGYNAKAYANTILNGDYAETMDQLVVAMLTYGAEAQRFFGHNTESLMDSGLTAEQKALIAGYDSTMMDDVVKADSAKTGLFVRDDSNFKELYPSVSFDGAFAINYYCMPAIPVDDGMRLYWWDAEAYASVEELTLENASGSMDMELNDKYWGQVSGIAAKDMDKTYYVTCVFESEGETVTSGIIAYSLGAYCESKAASDSDAQQAFAQATAVYGYYAKQFFAQN